MTIEVVLRELERVRQMLDDVPFIAANPADLTDHFREIARRRGMHIEESTLVERGKFYLIDPAKLRV